MMDRDPLFRAVETPTAEAERQTALDHMLAAWEEALLDGVEGDCMASIAIQTGLRELVAVFGEEPVAAFCARLPERIRAGEFSTVILRQ